MTPARPLSIVHIAAPGRVGGLERVVQGLARGHARQGQHVAVVSLMRPGESGQSFAAPIEEAGVCVHTLHNPSSGFLRERTLVRGLLKQIRPDIVHTHGYRPDVLHATTARRLSIPTVTTEHGSSKLGGKTVFYEWLQRTSRRRFQAVVAVSSPIGKRLVEEGIPRRKVHVIPNAWTGDVAFLSRGAARRALGLPEDRPVVGYVGRLIPAKGPDIFVDAFSRLGDLQICAAIIGEGTGRPRIESAIGADLGSRVFLVGHVDNAAPLFKAFDLFVLSSRTEGSPITLLEALAAEVPVVVTSVGGVPDVVSSREALLVPPEDPDALASAIRATLSSPIAAAERARAGAARLKEEFNGELWLGRHEALYRGVAGL